MEAVAGMVVRRLSAGEVKQAHALEALSYPEARDGRSILRSLLLLLEEKCGWKGRGVTRNHGRSAGRSMVDLITTPTPHTKQDEAASLQGMTFRQANAPQFFYGLFEEGDGALVGFVNGTCCVEEELHHATMSKCVIVRVWLSGGRWVHRHPLFSHTQSHTHTHINPLARQARPRRLHPLHPLGRHPARAAETRARHRSVASVGRLLPSPPNSPTPVLNPITHTHTHTPLHHPPQRC